MARAGADFDGTVTDCDRALDDPGHVGARPPSTSGARGFVDSSRDCEGLDWRAAYGCLISAQRSEREPLGSHAG